MLTFCTFLCVTHVIHFSNGAHIPQVHQRHRLYKPGFSLDTTDTNDVKFCIVMSSENLLLNLYRAYKSPQRLTIALDHTYRLTTENHPTLLIGVTAPGNNT
jgi:hypothetical protein